MTAPATASLRIGPVRRYFYGWWCFVRAIYLARTKKRGAGAMPWRYAVMMGLAYRWIADGQFRRSKQGGRT